MAVLIPSRRHPYHGVPAPDPVATTPRDERASVSPAHYLGAILLARVFEPSPLTCLMCGADIRIVAFVSECRGSPHDTRRVRPMPPGTRGLATGFLVPRPSGRPSAALPERPRSSSMTITCDWGHPRATARSTSANCRRVDSWCRSTCRIVDWRTSTTARRSRCPLRTFARKECRRARDTFWDLQAPNMPALGDTRIEPAVHHTNPHRPSRRAFSHAKPFGGRGSWACCHPRAGHTSDRTPVSCPDGRR